MYMMYAVCCMHVCMLYLHLYLCLWCRFWSLICKLPMVCITQSTPCSCLLPTSPLWRSGLYIHLQIHIHTLLFLHILLHLSICPFWQSAYIQTYIHTPRPICVWYIFMYVAVCFCRILHKQIHATHTTHTNKTNTM